MKRVKNTRPDCTNTWSQRLVAEPAPTNAQREREKNDCDTCGRCTWEGYFHQKKLGSTARLREDCNATVGRRSARSVDQRWRRRDCDPAACRTSWSLARRGREVGLVPLMPSSLAFHRLMSLLYFLLTDDPDGDTPDIDWEIIARFPIVTRLFLADSR
ncbi:unnamed protein product [Trichogramma brassicae]|uniref:Uncharacterized protein n=1 Tax=Trichogramma brassicae TaxID=86971 RepID=A0A6H5HZE8_9HYME|nr:unnamed protein product [Trichogramma brassicae]